MAKISLRVYLKEIDSLIDRGENAEAIAHCKYVLKIYPKYIPIYGLLGKAYLESQRYSEALDVFQRVLSVYPDDFIAHLSLSIIREGEENLDAAIFHMERAYEVQPANAGIQNELRRLYGRRDGVIPPRVRLTRGALVRMYERGELYRQAIAEIQSALAEHPDRIDLKVILCRMYFLAGQRVESTDFASQLISKLPFCFEANRILAEILPGTSRAEDAALYQKRVLDLDPYFAFTPLSSPNSSHVPDNAIQLEQLDVRMAEHTMDSGWAQNLGISLPGPSHDEELPDWFQTSTGQQPDLQKSLSAPEPISAQLAEDSEIPDFIRQAGFTAATGPEQPTTLNISEGEDIPAEGEPLASAEIPDWLQSIAPAQPAVDQSIFPEDESWFAGLVQQTPQLDQESPENIQLPKDSNESKEVAESPTTSAELPDWLRNEVPDKVEPSASTLPSWLSEPPVMPDRNELPEEPQPSASIPDWLQGVEVNQTTLPGQPGAELDGTEAETPEWLQTLSTPPIPPVEIPAFPTEPLEGENIPAELPDWITGIIPQVEDEVQAEEPLSNTLESPSLLASPKVQPDENLPIVTQFPPEISEMPPTPITETGEVIPSEAVETELPEGLADLEANKSPVEFEMPDTKIPAETEPDDQAAEAELPDWLSEIAAPVDQLEPEVPLSEATAETEPVGQAVEAELPDWLTEITAPEDQVEPEVPLSEATADLEPEGQAVEAELPDWLTEIAAPVDQVEPEVPLSEATAETELEGQAVEAELPDWLVELDQTIPQPYDAEPSVLLISPSELLSTEVSDLSEFEEIPPFVGAQPTLEEPASPVVESTILKAEPTHDQISEEMDLAITDELESQAPTQPIQIKLSSPESIEEPAFPIEEIKAEETSLPLDSIPSQSTIPEEIMVDTGSQIAEEMPTDLEAALAWMEALAARQGAIEGTLSVNADEQSTEMPQWLQSEVENSPETQLPPPPEEEVFQQPAEEPALQPQLTDQVTMETKAPDIEPIQPIEEILSSELESSTHPAEISEPLSEEGLEVLKSFEAPVLATPSVTEWVEPENPEVELPEWIRGVDENIPLVETLPVIESVSEEWVREEAIPDHVSASQPEDTAEPAVAPTSVVLSAESATPEQMGISTEIKTQAAATDFLLKAQTALRHNNLEEALNQYEELVNSGDMLEEAIHDLREAIDRHPMETPLYQILGDAYMKTNRLQEAIDAYTKAEQLLR